MSAQDTSRVDDAITLHVRTDGVAVVTIDQPGEAQNTLRAESTGQFHTLLDTIEADEAIRAVVVISGKEDSFVAGADIEMIRAVESAAEATQLSRDGQAAFARLEALRVPVVAAIHGACLGGGLEPLGITEVRPFGQVRAGKARHRCGLSIARWHQRGIAALLRAHVGVTTRK